MGNIFASGESRETKRSKMLDGRLELLAEDGRKIKVLVLGPPGAGKSTFVAQMKHLETKETLSESARKAMRPRFHAFVVTAMTQLIVHARAMHLGSPKTGLSDIVELADPTVPLTSAVAEAIAQLWKQDETIQRAFAVRNRLAVPLPDGAPWFFDKVTQLPLPSWIPSIDDCLRLHEPTRGLPQEDAWMRGVPQPFVWLDVSAHEGTERKKWLHSFNSVTAVVFVAALSDYEYAAAGDASVNALVDSFVLWAETVNLKWFDDAIFFLILNKHDVFESRIQVSSLHSEATGGDGDRGTSSASAPGMRWGGGLSTAPSSRSIRSTASGRSGRSSVGSAPPVAEPARFLDYGGAAGSSHMALLYIQERFVELVRRPTGAAPIVHVVSAVDTAGMRPVCKSMKEDISKHAVELAAATEA